MDLRKNENLWLAMVALAGQDPPEAGAVVEALRTAWPDLAGAAVSQSAPRAATITIGEAVAGLSHIPTPIPWSQLEGPCDVAWYWPQAEAALRGHQSHVLITLLDEGRRAIDKSIRLTQLAAAAAIAAAAPVGIFWGPGRLIHKAADFVDVARDMTSDKLPLFLWIDFRVVEEAEGKLALFTTGLQSLGYLELEVAGYGGSAARLVESVFNVAHYILEGKGTIRDGHTIGLADGTELSARGAASFCDPELEVLRLEFSAEDAAT